MQEYTAFVFRVEVNLEDGEVCSSEIFVLTCQTMQCHNAEDRNIFTTMKISNLPELFK
jgi:hypothetical protein